MDSKKRTNKRYLTLLSTVLSPGSFATSVPTRMPTVHFAVFAAGAALGVTAAALAQRRNDRLTLPMTPQVSTSATPGNTEISRIPVVNAGPTGNLGLARFHNVGSEVFKHVNPGESLHPFMCRSRFFAWIETTFVVIFLRFSVSQTQCRIQKFPTLCESRV